MSLISQLDSNVVQVEPLRLCRGREGMGGYLAFYTQPKLKMLEAISGLHLPPSMEKAVSGRQWEYLLARLLAGQILYDLGGELCFPGRQDRRPIWPEGFVGSLTHTEGCVAAVVARNQVYKGMGIDCERVMSDQRFERIMGHVLTEDDKKLFKNRPDGWSVGALGALIFSAKETLYKCLNPLTGCFFGFREASVVTIEAGTVTLQLETSLSPAYQRGYSLEIEFEFWDDKVLTLGRVL